MLKVFKILTIAQDVLAYLLGLIKVIKPQPNPFTKM